MGWVQIYAKQVALKIVVSAPDCPHGRISWSYALSRLGWRGQSGTSMGWGHCMRQRMTRRDRAAKDKFASWPSQHPGLGLGQVGMSRVTRSHRGRAPKYAHAGLHKLMKERRTHGLMHLVAELVIGLRMQLNAVVRLCED